jgi:flagellin-like protein
MKGVSEVIAIILILMIVIALAALAYTFFSDTMGQITGQASTSVTQTSDAMATSFMIEAARNSTIGATAVVNATLRNTGSQSVDLSKLTVYVNDAYVALTSGNTGTMASGATANIGMTVSGYTCNSILKVTGTTGFTQSKVISGC